MDKSDLYAPIGVIDSGTGGTTTWAEIVRRMPHEDIIYWADSAHCPYGERDRAEIIDLVVQGVEYLLAQGAKIIVLACNTATLAAITHLREKWPEIPFVGSEPAVKPAAQKSKSGVIGVLATRYTTESESFQKIRNLHANQVRVIATAGEGLVKSIEEGKEEAPETEAMLRQYIEPMLEAGADQLVLGCTHYPFLTPVIQKIVAGKTIEIINPAYAIVRRTEDVLREKGLLNDSQNRGNYRFISTAGEQEAKRLQERAQKYIQTTYGIEI